MLRLTDEAIKLVDIFTQSCQCAQEPGVIDRTQEREENLTALFILMGGKREKIICPVVSFSPVSFIFAVMD